MTVIISLAKVNRNINAVAISIQNNNNNNSRSSSSKNWFVKHVVERVQWFVGNRDRRSGKEINIPYTHET